MKTLLNYALLCAVLLLNSGAGCFNKAADPQPLTANHCKKIIVSEDGDETEYEFDGQGHLLKLFGQSVANYYKDPYNFKLQWKLDDSNIKLDRSQVAWGYEVMDGAKNGLENTLYPADRGKAQKIERLISVGYDAGSVAFEIGEDYVYDTNGDCIQLKNGESSTDGQQVLKYTANFKYTNKPSPFANHPFQWLIEQEWSAGGHTNTHLTDSEEYTIERVDDPDIKANIKRSVIYSYQYDKQGRVSRMQMDSQEIVTTTQLDTGQTFSRTEKKQKIVTFEYDC